MDPLGSAVQTRGNDFFKVTDSDLALGPHFFCVGESEYTVVVVFFSLKRISLLYSVVVEIITLNVDVVIWRVLTSSDGCAVLWLLLNNSTLTPFSNNNIAANFSFITIYSYIRLESKTVVQDVCSGLEEAVL